MIAAIRICGLGPHADTRLALDPYGVTGLSGPSEIGKSTLLDAICFCLWGTNRHGEALDLRAIRDGAREVRVEITTGRGAKLERSLALKEDGKRGETTRTLTKKDGSSMSFPTEKAWLAGIAWLGERTDALRIALVPLAWRPLEQSAHGGKALRDLLNTVLPTSSGRAEVIAELMSAKSYAFRRGDPLNEKDAGEQRRARGVKRDEAAGATATLQEEIRLAEQVPVAQGPTADEVARARDVVRIADLWAQGDEARERHAVALDRRQRALADHAAWSEQRAQIGARPAARARVAIESDIRTQEGVAARSEAAHRDSSARTTAQEVQPSPALIDACNRAAREAADANAALAATTDVCPCCDRPGWLGAKAAARKRADAATAAKLEADQKLEADLEHRRGVEAARAEGAAKDAARHEAAAKDARAKLDALRAELKTATEAERWDAQSRTLGSEPVVPPEPGEVGSDPAEERPHSDEVEVAREVLDAHAQAEGARRARAAALTGLHERFDAAREAHAGHAAEYDRLTALIEAIREEPSVSVRRKLGALGDLGPVSLELPDGGGARVLVDGRPWWLASTGRQVVADVWLRAGIRRALGAKAESWPLVIDCAQDVGGQELPTPTPAIVLTTTDGTSLAVATGERAA